MIGQASRTRHYEMDNTEVKEALTGDEPATTAETLSVVDEPIDQTVEETEANEEAKKNSDDDEEKIEDGLDDTTDAQDEIARRRQSHWGTP